MSKRLDREKNINSEKNLERFFIKKKKKNQGNFIFPKDLGPYVQNFKPLLYKNTSVKNKK